MKIKAIVRAFYNGSIVKPGEIVEFKGNKIPSWAKEIGKNKKTDSKTGDVRKNDEPKNKSEVDAAADTPLAKTDDEAGENNNEIVNDDLSQKTEEELNEILDDLFTQAAEKNILIDLEGKTVIEQIEDLKNAIERG